MRKRKETNGFTLIEMLIVIAVIGVLAVAVLSAINPVEQMRKARDTRRRSNAAELLNALERYYATNEEYPDDYSAAAQTGDDCSDAVPAGSIEASDLGTLVVTNELKSEFSSRIDDPDDALFGAIDSTSELAIVCYQIESDANKTKYADSSCLSGTDVHVCLPE